MDTHYSRRRIALALLLFFISFGGCEDEPDDEPGEIIHPINGLSGVGDRYFSVYEGQQLLYAVVDRIGEDSTVISRTCGQALMINGEHAYPVTTDYEYPTLSPAPDPLTLYYASINDTLHLYDEFEGVWKSMDYFIALESASVGDTVVYEATDSTSALAIVAGEGVSVTTPTFTFENCLEVLETRRVESVGVISRDSTIVRSWYLPGLGLVRSLHESYTVWWGSDDEFHGLSETFVLSE